MIMHIFAGLTELDHVENHLDFTSRFVFNSYLTFALSFHFYCYKIDQSVTAVLALLFLWLFCHFGFPVAFVYTIYPLVSTVVYYPSISTLVSTV
ncbi:hypothetical protein BDV3_004011 [Batrachochytrium dendrobatidis]